MLPTWNHYSQWSGRQLGKIPINSYRRGGEGNAEKKNIVEEIYVKRAVIRKQLTGEGVVDKFPDWKVTTQTRLRLDTHISNLHSGTKEDPLSFKCVGVNIVVWEGSCSWLLSYKPRLETQQGGNCPPQFTKNTHAMQIIYRNMHIPHGQVIHLCWGNVDVHDADS